METPNAYTLRIDLDNDAFGDSPEWEIARILRKQADKLEAGDYYRGHSVTLLDVNGNDVGRAKIHPER